jgi:diguanylate cyclase (GGDEF)-like protein/PAS domain S-box-containing protein
MDDHAKRVPAASPSTRADALPTPDTASQVSGIASLLSSLEEAASHSGQSNHLLRASSHENRLVQARLGIASGLYAALRCKHPATASHSLRVALACSSWGAVVGLTAQERDALEVAALLHDVGKIGVPDKVLMKPGRLLPDEAALMDRHNPLTVEVLASCGAPIEVLEIVHYSQAWYGSGKGSHDRQGDALPLGARMLSIVDAFDSMTTDHVYRPARSRERALAELFRCAGSQFDPELVNRFSELLSQDQGLLTSKLARHWLHRLPQDGGVVPWKTADYEGSPLPSPASWASLFETKLIDNMHDGVVFVDSQSRILLWNTGVERLTGVSGDAARGREFLPSLLAMEDAHRSEIKDADCPVARAIKTGVQWLGRVSIMGRHGRHVSVDLHAIPVRTSDGILHGATVLLHDVSSEASLEEKCQALHAQVAKDPLTQVANRAEFDRMLHVFVTAHQESNLPCSIIMCDIDHFKAINDTYGHQAGDEAIITFASILQSMCRSGDLVARYGGEEFAILCADCRNAAAARKAEAIRKRIAESRLVCLGARALNASFGVTELQPGDTPETMLRRADRGLLQAKDQGRNQVVQLGDGMMEKETKPGWWPFRPWRGSALVETTLVTAVTLEVAVQKLRGFIADHDAKIVTATNDQLRLELTDSHTDANRRHDDRPVSFSIDLTLSQRHVERSNSQGFAAGAYVETCVAVTIRPRRDRRRRRDYTLDKARRLLGSLKSYLMATEDDGRLPEVAAAAASTVGDG